MSIGIKLIERERNEQIEKHGHTSVKDRSLNNHYQLSEAAGLLTSLDMDDLQVGPEDCLPVDWDLETWKKMWHKEYEDRLIIAGALIAAELDRLHPALID